MDMNNPSEPRMPRVEDLKLLELMGVISSLCTIPHGHTPPWPTIRQLLGCTNPSCLVRSKGAVASSRPNSNNDCSGGAGEGRAKATGVRRRAASLRRTDAAVTLAQGGT